MIIRKFNESDISGIVSLFYETVHTINKQHYSQEQLEAWAPKDEEKCKHTVWRESLRHNITYVAETNDQIVGFSDMSEDGYIDRLYVHKDFQRQGIAKALLNTLESESRKRGLHEMSTDASITAKPFFERQGFVIIQKQIVERRGVALTNYKMIKQLLP
ncbi:putative acetyltransferase [Paenibacillus castaneae]|uniref:GNAT family N-acetyltransferase n=1 Tax=Paenibacillus castaneae TaxID=474957 RepID=UPI000C9A8C4C|nr:GNAT family N-acetyltransferase [Paenibacillus castaneae]NIK75255.1 putative acetyltransferase [Paenibacillus castaneae]